MLFTQDDDLPTEATRRQRRGESCHGVMYAYQLRVLIGDCGRELDLIVKAGEPEDITGRTLFLPL